MCFHGVKDAQFREEDKVQRTARVDLANPETVPHWWAAGKADMSADKCRVNDVMCVSREPHTHFLR